MNYLQILGRTYGNPGEGPPGGESGCPVQGGPTCPTWGSGPVWGDGTKWCSHVGVPFEFVVEKEAHIHRLRLRIKYTYCHTPGLPEAFGLKEIRARVAPDRTAMYPYQAFVDGTTPTERLSAKIRYTAVPGLADTSPNGRNGTIYGTPSFREASAIRTGNGMGFGPATGPAYVEVADDAVFNTAPFSVEFWARLDDTATNEWSTPIVKSTSSQWDDGWGFYDRHSQGLFTFWVNAYDGAPTPPATQRYVRVARPAAGRYHHYIGTDDGETASLYVDGVLVGQSTSAPGLVASASPVRIGYSLFSQSGWQGALDEVSIYTQALTQEQVTRHYETQRQEYRAVVLQDSPVGYWPMDEEGAYGNEFTLYSMQMDVQRKKHQPKG